MRPVEIVTAAFLLATAVLPAGVVATSNAPRPNGAGITPDSYEVEVVGARAPAVSDLPDFIKKLSPSAASALVFSLKISFDGSQVEVKQGDFVLSYKINEQTKTVACAALEAGGSWVLPFKDEPGSITLIQGAKGTVQIIFLLPDDAPRVVLYQKVPGGEPKLLKDVDVAAIRVAS